MYQQNPNHILYKMFTQEELDMLQFPQKYWKRYNNMELSNFNYYIVMYGDESLDSFISHTKAFETYRDVIEDNFIYIESYFSSYEQMVEHIQMEIIKYELDPLLRRKCRQGKFLRDDWEKRIFPIRDIGDPYISIEDIYPSTKSIDIIQDIEKEDAPYLLWMSSFDNDTVDLWKIASLDELLITIRRHCPRIYADWFDDEDEDEYNDREFSIDELYDYIQEKCLYGPCYGIIYPSVKSKRRDINCINIEIVNLKNWTTPYKEGII